MKHRFTLAIKALFIGFIFIAGGNVKAQTPTLVADINSGGDPSLPTYLTPFNGKLYFAADDGTNGMELWSYSGSGSPSMVANINSGSGSSDPQALTVFNNKLYFVADDGTNGRELWSYDGTGSPSMVANINSGSNWGIASFEPEMIVFNNALYFSATNGTNGMELWSYDGSSAPSMVYDIYSGSFGSNIQHFCVYKDTLFFKADNGTNGDELWRYTGTGNPSMVYDIRSGANPSLPSYMTVYNGKLYFAADEGTNGIELWSYDNVNNPSIAADINTGSNGSAPSDFIVYKNVLYFSADDGTTGLELYKFNGTSASLVEDIYPGLFNASFPTDFCVYNDTLYFSAGDGTSGLELRKYGGSGSVQLVAEIASGSSGSFPDFPVVFGGSLYFQADDAVKGAELWRITGPCGVTNTTLTIEACDEYTFNGTTYFMNNNTAKDTIMGAGGCDTIVTLNLTIKYSTYQDSFVNACGSVTLYDSTYTTSTIVDTLLMNAAGCDSLLTYYITINNNSNRDTFVTACGSFSWRSNTYSNSRSVVYTLPEKNATGCDSTVTLRLTIGNPTYSYQFDTACNNFFWRGDVYDTSGVYTDTIANSVGCDSILSLGLTIYKPTIIDTFATSCGVYTWRGITIIEESTVYDTVFNSRGCASVVTRLNLSYKEPSTNTINIVQCDSVDVNGTWYKDAGIYSQTLTAASGCDSILTINYAKGFGRDTMVVTECGKYNLNGTTYTSTGMYTLGIIGCDTTVLDLTIYNDADTVIVYDTACHWNGGYSFHWTSGAKKGYKYFHSSGIYYINIPRVAKCDSVVELHLFKEPIPPGYVYTKYFTVCDSITINGVTYDEEKFDYTVKYGQTQYVTGKHAVIAYANPPTPNSTCLVLTEHVVTFNHSVIENVTVMDCAPALVGGSTFNTTGNYTIRIETDKGCDSIVKLNYTVVDKDTTITKDTCDSYTLNGITYTTSGVYKQPLPGCPQDTITINLTIRQASPVTRDIITTCNTYTWQGKTYTESTTDTRTYTNAAGCDSMFTLNLTILPTIVHIDTVKACKSFTWRGVGYTNSGFYSDTLTAATGCDSIVGLELEILGVINNYPNSGLPSIDDHYTVSFDGLQTKLSDNGRYSAYLHLEGFKFGGYTAINLRVVVTERDTVNNSWRGYGYGDVTIAGQLLRLGQDIVVSDNGETVVVSYNHMVPSGSTFTRKSTVAAYTFNASRDSLVPKGTPITIDALNNYPLSIDVSADGNTMVIGTPYEVGFFKSGAIVYTFNGFGWLYKGSPQLAVGDNRAKGVDVDLLPSGDRVVVTGATTVNSLSGDTIQGDVIVYDWDGSSWQVFGHRIINILTEGLEPGKQTAIYASIGNDGSNTMAVTRDGSDKVLIYKYNTGTFTWEVLDTLTLTTPIDGEAYIQMSKDVTVIIVNDHVFEKIQGEWVLNTDISSTLSSFFEFTNNSFRLAAEPKLFTAVVREKPRTGLMNRRLKTYQLCDEGAIGIDEVAYGSTSGKINFITYPNPTTGVFTLRVDVPANMKDNPMQYEVYNLQGMVVKRGILNSAEGEIAIEGQPQGIYFVKFQIGGYSGTAKVMIQH